MPHLSAILLYIGYNGSGSKVHRRLDKTRKTTSNKNKQVELAGPTKAANRRMEKMAAGTSMHCIRRRGLISTFGTMGRHRKRAPEPRMEYGLRCNGAIQRQGRHMDKTQGSQLRTPHVRIHRGNNGRTMPHHSQSRWHTTKTKDRAEQTSYSSLTRARRRTQPNR
jgi:hypothetical protein